MPRLRHPFLNAVLKEKQRKENDRPSVPLAALKSPVNFLALGFGSGLVPWMPGTVGTLAAVPIYLVLQPLAVLPYLLVVVAISLAGIWICSRCAHNLEIGDHPAIVWDEIAGYLLTMTFAPVGWLWIVAGFVLFRFFDIIKPWPIGWADRRIGGGPGIMLDDILAGLYGAAVLWGLNWFFGLGVG